jgi:hypothetical protein
MNFYPAEMNNLYRFGPHEEEFNLRRETESILRTVILNTTRRIRESTKKINNFMNLNLNCVFTSFVLLKISFTFKLIYKNYVLYFLKVLRYVHRRSHIFLKNAVI